MKVRKAMEGRNERRCFPRASTRAEKLYHSHPIVGAVEASKLSVAGSVSRGYNTLGREPITFSVSLKTEPRCLGYDHGEIVEGAESIGWWLQEAALWKYWVLLVC